MKNEQHLSEIPVIKSLYGNISLDGNYLKYSKRMFDPVIEKIIQEELEILKEDSDPDVIFENIFNHFILGIRMHQREAKVVAQL